jgi:hypothetical protein
MKYATTNAVRLLRTTVDYKSSSVTAPGFVVEEGAWLLLIRSLTWRITMKSKALVSVALLSCVAFAPAVLADTIISSTGTGLYGFSLGGSGDQVLYASWTTLGAYSNVDIAAEVGSSGASSSTIYAYLTTVVGPSETGADVVASTTITPSSETEMDTIFTGLNLGAGAYYLVLTGGDSDSTFAAWEGTGAATVATTGAGVTFSGDGGADAGEGTNNSNPPASTFTNTSADAGLLFQVTGDAVSPVPEPDSISFMLTAGLAGFWLYRRRRTA